MALGRKNNMALKYNIKDRPSHWWEWCLYPLQIVLAVFVATVLIANICKTPVSSSLLGACIGTLIYMAITRFKSPMFISSCGATVSAVSGALALNSTNSNYLMVFCGGLIILAVYGIFALIVKFAGIKTINKIFPPTIVGAVTVVIGLNLATYIAGYTSVIGVHTDIQVGVAIIVMAIVAITTHYGKGLLKNIPFLIGIIGGYLICLIIQACGVKIIDFTPFENIKWYPDLTFLQWSSSDWSWANLGKTTLFFVPVAICALLEHYSDHKVLSNIIGTDLTEDPGLDKTLLGDGVASAVGTAICGLPNTSYGESIAVIGFSKVASVWTVCVAAVAMGVMSFIGPVQAFVQSIPQCVFGGCAMILYGYIAASGLKTMFINKVDLDNNKNLIIVSVILTVGVSGIYFLDPAFAGVSLSMVLGILLNVLLYAKKIEDKN